MNTKTGVCSFSLHTPVFHFTLAAVQSITISILEYFYMVTALKEEHYILKALLYFLSGRHRFIEAETVFAVILGIIECSICKTVQHFKHFIAFGAVGNGR